MSELQITWPERIPTQVTQRARKSTSALTPGALHIDKIRVFNNIDGAANLAERFSAPPRQQGAGPSSSCRCQRHAPVGGHLNWERRARRPHPHHLRHAFRASDGRPAPHARVLRDRACLALLDRCHTFADRPDCRLVRAAASRRDGGWRSRVSVLFSLAPHAAHVVSLGTAARQAPAGAVVVIGNITVGGSGKIARSGAGARTLPRVWPARHRLPAATAGAQIALRLLP